MCWDSCEQVVVSQDQDDLSENGIDLLFFIACDLGYDPFLSLSILFFPICIRFFKSLEEQLAYVMWMGILLVCKWKDLCVKLKQIGRHDMIDLYPYILIKNDPIKSGKLVLTF